ncbi:nuclear transport factor 2 family protein [Hyphomonas sp.]|uniref:nuclear transport factor 2 family protein n=1 Tax=Hyphomonas sp. TaxID=87 RepID=UPI00391DF271
MSGFRLYMAACSMTAALALGGCNSDELRPQDKTVIISETGDFLQTWAETRLRGSGADLAPMYWPDSGFLWIEDGRVMHDYGPDAAAALDFSATGGYTPELLLSNFEITPIARNVAAVSGDYVQALRLGTVQIEGPGVFTATLVKKDERWQFVHAHFSPTADFTPAALPEP